MRLESEGTTVEPDGGLDFARSRMSFRGLDRKLAQILGGDLAVADGLAENGCASLGVAEGAVVEPLEPLAERPVIGHGIVQCSPDDFGGSACLHSVGELRCL